MSKLEIADILLSAGCLQLRPKNPFTYASGLKGPIYCDNRLILSDVAGRKIIVQKFLDVIKSKNLNFQHLAGLATAGIPYASILADHLDSSMIYIRGKAKSHGRQNQIEGRAKTGEKILLIEDLVNQGSSLKSAVQSAREAGLKLSACLCIVDYETPKAHKILEQLHISLYALTDFKSVLEAARRAKTLTEEEIKLIKDWHTNPTLWK